MRTRLMPLVPVLVALSLNLAPANVILVPENYTTIQAAIDYASDGDVISVWGPPPGQPSNPPYHYYENVNYAFKSLVVAGRCFLPNWQGCTPTWDSVVIDGGQSGPVVSMGGSDDAVLKGFTIQTGWDGQQMVNRPDADTAEGQPCIALDSAGCPWIVWDRNCTDTTMLYTRWQGSRWDEQSGAGANAPGVAVRLRPSICFDSRGRAWLAWHNVHSNDRRDIAACHWDDSLWTPEQHVSPPESTDRYFAPKVSCGGGQVWCVWYGGPSDGLPYSVFASRWDSLKGSWTPETRVSPPDSNHHWWCDVAVDSVGTPHVVWCTHPLYTVFYSYFDGQQWVEPIPVNDTTQVTASPWASPRIVIDRTGVMHLCFTGARVGASHRDIFYTRNDVSGWAPCQMVTRDSLYDEWYSDIAANRPDNVWVVWNRQNEGSDQFRVYASHWDGTAWSFEQRLDDTTSYYDFDPVVCLDDDGYPWVVWSGTTYGATDDVYYNRYMSHGSLVGGPHGACGRAFTLAVTSPARHGIRFSFSIAQNGRVGLVVYDVLGRCIKRVVDGVLPAGQHSAVWNRRMADGEPAPAGAYIGRLDAAGCVAKCRFTLVSD